MITTESPLTALERATGATYRQLDYWATKRLLGVDIENPGQGSRRDWAKVSVRRVRACQLAIRVVESIDSVHGFELVDILERHGEAVVDTPAGTITLRLSDD